MELPKRMSIRKIQREIIRGTKLTQSCDDCDWFALGTVEQCATCPSMSVCTGCNSGYYLDAVANLCSPCLRIFFSFLLLSLSSAGSNSLCDVCGTDGVCSVCLPGFSLHCVDSSCSACNAHGKFQYSMAGKDFCGSCLLGTNNLEIRCI